MEIRYIAAAAALSAVLALHAQSNAPLRGTVEVDGKFLPDVIRQDKVNTLPRLYSVPLETSTLQYETKGVVTPFEPTFSPMPVLAWQSTRRINKSRGYVNLQAGSWLDASLSAGYRFIDDGKTQFGVWLQHNSTSLWKPELSEATKDYKRRRYDEVIGFDFSQKFGKAGQLFADLTYHYGNFNYYGFYNPQGLGTTPAKAPGQNLNDLRLRGLWKGTPSADLGYRLGLGLHHVGYGKYYMPSADGLWETDGAKETHVTLNGGVDYKPGEPSVIAIDVEGGLVTYADNQGAPMPRTYGHLDFNPYYRYTSGDFSLKAGANLNLLLGDVYNENLDGYLHGTGGKKFHASPDVRIDYRAGICGLYLHVGGGQQLNTMAYMMMHDYYGTPSLYDVRPVNTPLDAKAGINFGPFSGITAGVAFAYKNTRHIPLYGLYTYDLNHYMPNEHAIPGADLVWEPSSAQSMSVKGWSLEANVRYRYGEMIEMGIAGSYQPQDGMKGYYNGMDRPRWILDATASFCPVKPLRVTLQYGYRGVRKAYVGRYTSTFPEDTRAARFVRLPDVTDLSARVDYQLNDAISFSLQGNNLLGRRIDLMPDLPCPGAIVLGGVQFVF